MRGQLESHETILRFMLAGDARITIVSTKTGTRFTYRVEQKIDRSGNEPVRKDLWFVGVLTGSQNDHDFTYLGTVRPYRFFPGKKSKIGSDAPSARAFTWFADRLFNGGDLSNLEVWHEGRCGRCGRSLTVPESLASGLGPICEGKAA